MRRKASRRTAASWRVRTSSWRALACWSLLELVLGPLSSPSSPCTRQWLSQLVNPASCLSCHRASTPPMRRPRGAGCTLAAD